MNSQESYQNYLSYCISDISTSTYKSEIEKVVEGLGLPYKLQIWIKKKEHNQAIFTSTQLPDSDAVSDLDKNEEFNGLFDSMEELNGFTFGGRSLLVRGIRGPKPSKEKVKALDNELDRELQLSKHSATHPNVLLSNQASSKSSSPKRYKKNKRSNKSEESENPVKTKVGVKAFGPQCEKRNPDGDLVGKGKKTQEQRSSKSSPSSKSLATSTSKSIH